jgi:hypothetical protein
MSPSLKIHLTEQHKVTKDISYQRSFEVSKTVLRSQAMAFGSRYRPDFAGWRWIVDAPLH